MPQGAPSFGPGPGGDQAYPEAMWDQHITRELVIRQLHQRWVVLFRRRAPPEPGAGHLEAVMQRSHREGATIDDITIEDYWAAGAQHSVDGLWVTVPGDAGDRVQDWKQQRQTTGDNQVTSRDCFTRETGIVRLRQNLREEVDDTQPECKISDDSHTGCTPR